MRTRKYNPKKIAVVNRKTVYLEINKDTENGERFWVVGWVYGGLQPGYNYLPPVTTRKEAFSMAYDFGRALERAGHTIYIVSELENHSLDSEYVDAMLYGA